MNRATRKTNRESCCASSGVRSGRVTSCRRRLTPRQPDVTKTVKTLVATLAFLLALAFTTSAQIVISEIHYHPVEEPTFNADGTPVMDLSDDVHEFIEIQNTGAGPVNLSGWTLTGGIGYTFPSNTTIAAGAFRVIAKTPAR